MSTRKLPALFTKLAVFAAEAADQAGCARDYRALIAAIEENERAHRQLGLRMNQKTNRAFPVKDAVSYFVVRTLSDAYTKGPETPIHRYFGMRDDFIRAALLAANPRWREAFERILTRAVQNAHMESFASPAALLEYVSNLASYEELAA